MVPGRPPSLTVTPRRQDAGLAGRYLADVLSRPVCTAGAEFRVVLAEFRDSRKSRGDAALRMSLITVRPQLRPDKHYVFAPSQSILPRCCLCFFERELPEILPSDIAFDFPRRHDACTTLARRVHHACTQCTAGARPYNDHSHGP